MILRAATRGSVLARWQADRVGALLHALDPSITIELVIVETHGDRVTDRPLHELGGQGVFVKDVQRAVLDGRADFAVHSAKDLPSTVEPGLVIASVPERADPRDCLVGRPLAELTEGATIATGSVRRAAQLAHLRPDLVFTELRGNIQTRLAKVPAGGAIVMAVAALERLDLADRIAETLEPEVMLPQVAQGALAVECRADDRSTAALLAGIEDPAARRAVDAERAFLAELGGGCDLPVGAFATGMPAGALALTGLIADANGRRVVRDRARGSDPVALGRAVARSLLERHPDLVPGRPTLPG